MVFVLFWKNGLLCGLVVLCGLVWIRILVVGYIFNICFLYFIMILCVFFSVIFGGSVR